jgi:hypothetical protein
MTSSRRLESPKKENLFEWRGIIPQSRRKRRRLSLASKWLLNIFRDLMTTGLGRSGLIAKAGIPCSRNDVQFASKGGRGQRDKQMMYNVN